MKRLTGKIRWNLLMSYTFVTDKQFEFCGAVSIIFFSSHIMFPQTMIILIIDLHEDILENELLI